MSYYYENQNPTVKVKPRRTPVMPEVKEPKVVEEVKSDNSVVNDNVNHPSHYTDGKIEVIDYIEDKQLGFCLGNAIKYISRAGKKKSGNMTDKEKEINDLRKAVWYVERRIKELENTEE